MKTIADVIKRYVSDVNLGLDESDFDQAAFKSDLESVRKQVSLGFYGLLFILVIAFIAAILIVYLHPSSENVALVFGAEGLLSVGIFGSLLALWKERTRADLLLTIVRYCRREDLTGLINGLATK